MVPQCLNINSLQYDVSPGKNALLSVCSHEDDLYRSESIQVSKINNSVRSTYAAVAENTSLSLPSPKAHKLAEKQALKMAISPSRIPVP
jgi:hypothetical protein